MLPKNSNAKIEPSLPSSFRKYEPLWLNIPDCSIQSSNGKFVAFQKKLNSTSTQFTWPSSVRTKDPDSIFQILIMLLKDPLVSSISSGRWSNVFSMLTSIGKSRKTSSKPSWWPLLTRRLHSSILDLIIF